MITTKLQIQDYNLYMEIESYNENGTIAFGSISLQVSQNMPSNTQTTSFVSYTKKRPTLASKFAFSVGM